MSFGIGIILAKLLIKRSIAQSLAGLQRVQVRGVQQPARLLRPLRPQAGRHPGGLVVVVGLRAPLGLEVHSGARRHRGVVRVVAAPPEPAQPRGIHSVQSHVDKVRVRRFGSEVQLQATFQGWGVSQIQKTHILFQYLYLILHTFAGIFIR